VFRFHFTVNTELDDPVVGLAITHRDGQFVTGTNTSRHGLVLGKVEPGTRHVDFVVPSLPLVDGTYDLTVAITDHTEFHQIDRWQHAFRFDVARGKIFEEGLVTFGGHWALDV
jgi:lipopolysaccharide transport system ATP-binding protein